jgi:hypothetical protein
VCEFQIYSCFDYLKYVLDIAWDLILYGDTLKMVCHLSEIHTYLDSLYFLFTVVNKFGKSGSCSDNYTYL